MRHYFGSVSKQMVCFSAKELGSGVHDKSTFAGAYLLKDGSVSWPTVYDQEKGILLNGNLYLDLNISAKKFSFDEAKALYSALGEKTPDLYQLICLQNAVSAVNNSLKAVGMADCVLPDNVLESVWCEDYLKKPSPDEKRCVIIRSVGDDIEPYYDCPTEDSLILGCTQFFIKDGISYKQCDFILLCNWKGLDFLAVEENKDTFYFYRTNLQIHYLGKDCRIEILSDDLIKINDDVYQNRYGDLHYLLTKQPWEYICGVSADGSFNIREECVDGYDNEGRHTTVYEKVFRKNKDGFYEKVSEEKVDEYSILI